MTATTVFGVAHRAGGLSRTTSVSGRFQDALLIRKIDRELPEAGIVVTVDHDSDAAVGEVVYCEFDRYERLNVVSVLDGDWTEVEQPLFYSGEFKDRAEPTTNGQAWIADHACLIGMSITAHPASLEAQALRVMPGDIRKTPDRARWPVSFGWDAPLLDRALRSHHERRGGPLILHDERGRLDLDHRSHPAEIAQAMEEAHWSRRPPGKLRHATHRGRVLAVR